MVLPEVRGAHRLEGLRVRRGADRRAGRISIKRQPDLGTALLIAASGFYVLFLAGLSWKIIAGLGASAPRGRRRSSWQHLHGYQRERILTFIDPARDPLGRRATTRRRRRSRSARAA